MYVHVCVYIYIYTRMYVYIYIYVYKLRIYAYVYMFMLLHIPPIPVHIYVDIPAFEDMYRLFQCFCFVVSPTSCSLPCRKPVLFQADQCTSPPCHDGVDCVWGNWNEWSDCVPARPSMGLPAERELDETCHMRGLKRGNLNQGTYRVWYRVQTRCSQVSPVYLKDAKGFTLQDRKIASMLKRATWEAGQCQVATAASLLCHPAAVPFVIQSADGFLDETQLILFSFIQLNQFDRFGFVSDSLVFQHVGTRFNLSKVYAFSTCPLDRL